MHVIQFVSDTGTQHALISGPGPDPGYEQLHSSLNTWNIYKWNEIAGILGKLAKA